jgi:2-polyprenyl-3-methyl-5-hydroxy-6-metoxy-1,4-benzoquinol methylase
MSEADVDRSLQFRSMFAHWELPKSDTDEILKASSTFAQFRVGLLVQLANHDQRAADIVARWREGLKRPRAQVAEEIPSPGDFGSAQYSDPPPTASELSLATRAWKYSDAFEDSIAAYATGNPADRGEKTILEIYTKLYWAQLFFAAMETYVKLSSKRFIEVGCGTGFVSAAAASRGAVVSSTDLMEPSASLAKRRIAEHGLSTNAFPSDLRHPIPKIRLHSFDVVWCFQVLEHIPRVDQFIALGNLFSLVAPGGFLFIETENSLCPFDRHDTQTWLIRLTSKQFYSPIIEALGKGLNFLEPSTGEPVQVRDYLSYDEIIGAASVSGFKVVNAFMPHLTKKQYLLNLTKSDWLHDSILDKFDVERFAPVSVLLQRKIGDYVS